MKNVFLFVCIASFLFTLPAQCQWGTELGDNVTLASGEGTKYNVLIEPGPDDSWYIAYTNATGDNLNQIHLARVSSTGIILWDHIILDPSASGYPETVMVSDNSDGVIMAWIDFRTPDNPLIYANRIDLDGNKLWGENDLKVGTSEGQQQAPKIIRDEDAGAFITCNDQNTGNGETLGAYAYRVSSAGSVLWRKYLFPNWIVLSSDRYTITTDGEGGLIAFGIIANTSVTENQIRGMRLDANGTKLWPDETLFGGVSIGKYFQGASAMAGGEEYMYINSAFHPSVGVYLVYNKYPSVSLGDIPTDEMGQLIDIDGNKLWADEDVLIAELNTWNGTVNTLTDHDGNLYFNFGTVETKKLQKVLSDGTLPWTMNGVDYVPNMFGPIPQLALTSSNDVMVPFDGIEDIIHVSRIDGTGEMVYDPPALPLSVFEMGYQQVIPVIRANADDQVIAVWAEYADANDDDWDLKMQGFHVDGTLGNATSVRNVQPTAIKMYPNPISNREELVIETSEIELGNVSLIQSNGKTVFVANNIDFRNGATTISLPNELSSGIYFLQISNDTRVFSSKLAVY